MTHRKRRAEVLTKIGAGSIAIIPTAPHQRRNSDVLFPYRPDSDFYYLTHFPEPEAVAVLAPGHEDGEFFLFCRERDPEKEIWDGRRAGIDGAIEHYGADAAYPISKFDEMLPILLQNRERIFYPVGRYATFDSRVLNSLSQTRSRSRMGVSVPAAIIDIGKIVHEMRLFKQPDEVEQFQRAANISAQAHCAAMQVCAPGMREYQIQAEIEYRFASHGCVPAYPSIVAGGENACILHYINNTDVLKDGDLLLIDAGAEYDGCASDITRTFPINGRFTDCQRAVYEVVLEAQRCSIAKVVAGNRYNDVVDVAVSTIAEGLIELGILKCSHAEALETEAYKPYYMHKVGHWLGQDVHDVGSYHDGSHWRALEPNMYMTIEPGIYLAASDDIDEKWHGIGIRIEDDVFVTDRAPRVTTEDVPKQIDEIEKLMAS